MGLHRGARPIHRQIEAVRGARELAPSSRRAAPRVTLAADPLALADREVGVLDRQLRKLGATAVERFELGEEDAARGVVGADVVRDDEEQVLVGARDARGRRAAARPTRGRTDAAPASPSSSIASVSLPASATVSSTRPSRRHLLHRRAVDQPDRRAQDLVARDDGVERRAAAPRVERRTDPHEIRDVVRRAPASSGRGRTASPGGRRAAGDRRAPVAESPASASLQGFVQFAPSSCADAPAGPAGATCQGR